ncbi:MAG: hypothetical protein JNJ73_19570 [Hyphomonadaceae bacterium]|nr:hypothetical protein [Hyphomonadaceae bacterium]
MLKPASQMAQDLLSDAWAWDFPASDWERDVVAELLDLPIYDIPRLPADEVARMGMLPNACHANVRRCVESNPGMAIATGWVIERPDFMLHSVLQTGDRQFICVTPSAAGETGFVPFMPDAKISWAVRGQEYAPVRNGRMIEGPGVRQHPAFTIAKFKIIRERLGRGVPVEEAITFTRDEFETLRQAHIPKA